MTKEITKKLTVLENLIKVQRDCVENKDPSVEYMHGMLNGLICAHSVFSETSPIYYTRKGRRRDKKIRHKSLHKGHR